MTRRISTLLILLAACGGGAGAGDDGGPDGGPDGGAPVDGDAAYLFDFAYLHSFDIEVDPADWQWLNDNATLEEYRPATVAFEGHRWEGAAIRFKGSYGTLESCSDPTTGERLCPKLSLKVKFDEYDAGGRFYGLRKLIFNSSVRDDTLMHEVVTYHLFRSLGVPAPRASHALVSVNGEPQGVFVLVEDVDKEFVQDHWGAADEGNLYKSVWPQYADPAPYRDALATNEGPTTDVSRMLALHDAIAAASDATFTADMVPYLDLPALARYLAVDRTVSSDDGIKGFYCYAEGETAADCRNANYYWYEVPDGVTQLIPWDVDYTLGDVNTDLGRSYWDADPSGCQLISFCDYWHEDPCTTEGVWLVPPQCNRFYGLLHRATWNGYRDALAALRSGALADEQLTPLITAIRDKLRPAVDADGHGPGILAWESGLDWMMEVLAGQRDEIDRLLAEPPM